MLNPYSGLEMSDAEAQDIMRFTWNAKPTQDQIDRMNALREKGKDLCVFIISVVPNSADRSAAIRDLRKAITQCNLAIAHENLTV